MKFEVHATVTEIYYVEAGSFEEALEIASDREKPDDSNPNGFDYVRNADTGAELFM